MRAQIREVPSSRADGLIYRLSSSAVWTDCNEPPKISYYARELKVEEVTKKNLSRAIVENISQEISGRASFSKRINDPNNQAQTYEELNTINCFLRGGVIWLCAAGQRLLLPLPVLLSLQLRYPALPLLVQMVVQLLKEGPDSRLAAQWCGLGATA